MTTTEVINGCFVTIEWFFDDTVDNLKTNWYLWRVEGTGSDGKKYQGLCEADGQADLKSFVTGVEEIEYDLPENWELDYNGSSNTERQEQMHNWQKLK